MCFDKHKVEYINLVETKSPISLKINFLTSVLVENT